MSGPFYFTFSSGEYSDYGIGDICICDHEVSKDEWHKHYQVFQDEKAKLQWELMGYASWDEWYDGAGNYDALQLWEITNLPEKTFQQLHDMTVLNITNFHRDS